MKKDTENLDILLLLKSQPLHRVAPFSVPSAVVGKLLEKIREGNTYPHDKNRAVSMVVGVITLESEYQSEFMKLLRPEEKGWFE